MATVGRVQRLVAVAECVSVSALTGPDRTERVVAARHLAIHIALTLLPDLTMGRIGTLFGGRDHTTILSARRKMIGLLARDASLRARAVALMKACCAEGNGDPGR